jgi:hypothetical protein
MPVAGTKMLAALEHHHKALLTSGIADPGQILEAIEQRIPVGTKALGKGHGLLQMTQEVALVMRMTNVDTKAGKTSRIGRLRHFTRLASELEYPGTRGIA